MIDRRCAVAILFAVSGCGHLVTSTAPTDSDAEVCERYGRYLHTRAYQSGPLLPQYLAEVQKRGLLSADEMAAVQARRIGIGMSECALFAAWGTPTRANRSVWRTGSRVQYVYRDMGYQISRSRYVYVEDGKITGWQN